MSDTMQLLSLNQLLKRMFEEYRAEQSIFGIHESLWYRKADARRVQFMREQCDLPLGPAAGPQTQLAQNIVAAYLSGSRFFELKTVQILDALEIEKPCIDAGDEGYNTEWSTELCLDTAWQEYARAWIALHVVEEVWDLRSSDQRSFIFNMSVGYDLEGIRQAPMQQFIARMQAPGEDPRFIEWLDELEELLPSLTGDPGLAAEPGLPAGPNLAIDADTVARIRRRASAPLCRSVTLSTMHGCPPHEIEAICRYMLEDQQLDTYVKLNPTLLGYDRVREILNHLGYDYVLLDRSGFDHDLQYPDALGILRRLQAKGREMQRGFGVKLTNTLAVTNDRDTLPGDQMYLSGRALYPLALNLAARIAEDFNGELPISFCGGITAHNAAAVLRTGVRPLTLCTVLLKPGGYTRLTQIARELETVDAWDGTGIVATGIVATGIDVGALKDLAQEALRDRTVRKDFRGTGAVRIAGPLPTYDCYQAPCVAACPIGQHVPEYIRLVGEKRYAEALELIYERNALPAITGHICDHQCQSACTRLDYEGCINIRELKKIAVEQGTSGYRSSPPAETPADEARRGTRCAVIGAGPAGLAAAYFLAREGFAVTVFEREQNAGGVVRNVIPHFRLPLEAIEQDIEFIAARGVQFVFGADPRLTAEGLRAEGYGPIFVAVGAEVDNDLQLTGDRSRVVHSLGFLRAYRGNRKQVTPGRHVVVTGGGNTAMDAARAALTLPDVEHVSVLYRRSEAEMPADREEYENARAEGAAFHFLRNPEHLDAEGTLTVRVMELGEPDSSGRRRPLPTAATESLRVDTLITAIGERVDTEMLRRFGVPLDDSGKVEVDPRTLETGLPGVYLGGDAATGPSTVVQCIAAGRRAADAIIRREDPAWVREERLPGGDRARTIERTRHGKATILAQPDPHTRGQARSQVETFVTTEYDRCLQCSYVCNKCVEVCPNRANITVSTISEHGFNDPFQIVHLDAYCNECGNCARFCPWEDKVPYRDKPTLFSSRAAFNDSSNDGWLLEGESLRMRFEGTETTATLRNGRVETDLPGSTRFRRLFEILYHQRPNLFSAMEAMR